MFVQLVIAAMTTEPCSSRNESPSSATGTDLGSTSTVETATGSASAAASPVGGSLAGNEFAISLS